MNRCRQCDATLEALASSARYCSPKCRAAWRRANPPTAGAASTEVTDRVTAQLDALSIDDHPVRALAVVLAQTLDSGAPPGAIAGITRQLVALLDQATEIGTSPEPDFVDVLRARIREKSTA